MKKTILLLIIITASFAINAAVVSACSCMESGTPTEELGKSSAVFSGRVVGIEDSSGRVALKVTFEVSKVWKGPSYETLVVKTAGSTASCGYPFEEGQEYLVYTFGEGDDMWASICSKTRPLSNAQEDLTELGEGNVPTTEGSNLPVEPGAPAYSTQDLLYVIIAILIVALICVVLYFTKLNK